MKQGMTNVDVAALAAELRPLLAGGRVDKAYQPAKDQVVLRCRSRHAGRVDLLFHVGRYLTATRRPPENPAKPSMVAQVLRTDLGNGRIQDVHQVGFDRVLRIDIERGTGTHALVFELFGDGNMLLLDPDGTIRLPLRGEDFAHRKLRKGEVYVPPPAGPHPLQLDRAALEARGQAAERDLVRFLALELGFGPQWAEELCLRAAVDKRLKPPQMAAAHWDALHEAIAGLAAEIGRNDLAPGVVLRDGEPIDAVPFPLQSHAGLAYEEAPTFADALDRYFVGTTEDDDEDPRQARFDDARAKLQRQVDQIDDAMAGFAADEEARRADAEALYASFQDVQAILDQLHKAREGRSWEDVAAVLAKARDAGDQAAARVPDLRPHEGTAVLRVHDVEGRARDVEVDLRLSVQENAERQFEAAKKARSRAEGATKALADAHARVAALEAKGLDGFGAAPSRTVKHVRHFWFETYRYTVTPSGLVAVGGRNAAQNDAVVKKYLRDGDRYVHAEIHGAPSVVVRPVDGPAVDVSEEDLRVACQFAACASRAWRQFGEASAYWVTAAQVSKTPRSGEFVPRGAWIVHGKRNTMAGLPMRWAVGLVRFRTAGTPLRRDEEDDRAVAKLVGGPPEALAPYADAVAVTPGQTDPNDAAAWLAERFEVEIQDAQAALPPGPVRVEGMP